MVSMKDQIEILVIGAGSSGLMAARELAKAGKKVTILESRDRIGGRIWSLSEVDFGYPAQGGGEFVHGEAPVTKALIQEAGLTFVSESEDGEVWTTRDGPLSLHKSFTEGSEALEEKLEKLDGDISVADFLHTYFDTEQYTNLRNSILKMVEGYDAADPHRVSALTLKSSWFGKVYHADGWIKEGYGGLLNFLKKECEDNGVEIIFNTAVISIEYNAGKVTVKTPNGKPYHANKAIITVPLPVLKTIKFVPDISEKISLVSKIGFGSAIKLLIKFKSQWWKHSTDKDLSKLSFALCNDDFTAWWTQYPIETNVIVGWMAGPNAEKNKDLSEDHLFDLGILALANIFSLDKDFLRNEVEMRTVINWSSDPYALGAYSYTAMDTADARERLAEPVGNTIFFAGEALCTDEETATVEGALRSGLDAAKRVLNS